MLTAIAWAGLFFLMAPLLAVTPISITPKRYLSFPEGEYSIRHYAALIWDEQWLNGILTSLLVAVLTAVLAMVIGTLCAVGLWRIGGRYVNAVRLLILTPLIVPPIVHALAFYRTWIDLDWLDTVAGLVIAHTLICIPLVVITVSASLSNFDIRLEYAARSLGAQPHKVLRRVILPSIMPGVVSGGLFAFITSWDEIIVALFITARHVQTLPRVIWSSIMERVDPAIAAISTVMVIATLAGVAIRHFSTRQSASSQSKP
ncbi:ABC transporter permease [Rhodobacteraceae bacterium NNCM2]|nr:ABC transporter permease [Coraliihabitans acroporae]